MFDSFRIRSWSLRLLIPMLLVLVASSAAAGPPAVSLEVVEYGDMNPTPASSDPHRLGVRINWTPTPTQHTIWGHDVQQWNPFTSQWIDYASTWVYVHPWNYWEDPDLRGQLAFRVRTRYLLSNTNPFTGQTSYYWGFSNWSATEVVTVAPRQDLKVTLGWDWDLDGVLEGEDIETALGYCYPGCNLLLFPGTYQDVNLELGDFPDGLAIYGAGRDATVLRSRVFMSNPWEPVVLLGQHDFTDPVFQDFTIEGRRGDQPFTGYINSDERSGFATHLDDGGSKTGGVVQYLGVRDVIGAGIHLRRAQNWTVRKNVVENVGCYMRDDVPAAPAALRCGENLVEGPGMPLCSGANPVTPCKWSGGVFVPGGPNEGAMQDAELPPTGTGLGYAPGVKATGFGIFTDYLVDGSVVEDNYVTSASKIAIEGYSSANVTFARNIAEYSRAGITMNGNAAIGGARRIDIVDNVSRHNGLPGLESKAFGDGFECGWGRELTFKGNLAHDNARGGFQVGCIATSGAFVSHLVRNDQGVPNRSFDNCQTTTAVAEDLKIGHGGLDASPPWAAPPSLVDGFVSSGGLCLYGITAAVSADISIRDVDVQSGTKAVFNLDRLNALSPAGRTTIENATVWAAAGQSPQAEVFFDVNGNAMHDVAVIDVSYGAGHAGTFQQPYEFSDPTYVNGDQDISYCPEDDTLPGCPNEP